MPDSPPMLPTPHDDVPLMTLAFCAEAQQRVPEDMVRGRKRALEFETEGAVLPPVKRQVARVRIEDLLN
ncbi:hypothetical protein HK097_006685 [Rhizophlyctis rosea]|uniref:Uncharacterized protein n=1 Tax=Rhizophlyctis rosea TaxID=64517 RepID=A0AAD5S0E4_9FUNG|nr:hypothetical protein HK097_006685 [Rhizophlyctis rosea]